MYSTQYLRIRDRIRRHRLFADFTEAGLGDSLLKAAELGVRECITNQCAPDGTAWAPLSENYRIWKEFEAPGQPMGILYYVMAQPEQITGIIYMSTDEATMTYGTTEEAREEAAWFQQGDPANNRPGRPFFGLTAWSLAESKRILDERFRLII